MTAQTTPLPLSQHPSALRAQLEAPRFRERLAASLRRRVPASDAEDLVQSILCEALAADAPADPEEIPRWIAGIARHKVADFYRRARRERPSVGGDLDPGAEAVPVETRDLLQRVASDAARDARARQTLEWIVREHEGEALSDIAAQNQVAAPVVRQRVSRMRRALRRRWVTLLFLALAGGGAVAYFATRDEVAQIVPEPQAARQGAPSASPIATAQGTWTAEKWAIDPSMDSSYRALAELYVTGLVVRVSGSKVTLASNGTSIERTVSMRQVGPDSFVASSGADSAHVKVDGERLTVSSKTGVWRGTVVLRRAR